MGRSKENETLTGSIERREVWMSGRYVFKWEGIAYCAWRFRQMAGITADCSTIKISTL